MALGHAGKAVTSAPLCRSACSRRPLTGWHCLLLHLPAPRRVYWCTRPLSLFSPARRVLLQAWLTKAQLRGSTAAQGFSSIAVDAATFYGVSETSAPWPGALPGNRGLTRSAPPSHQLARHRQQHRTDTGGACHVEAVRGAALTVRRRVGAAVDDEHGVAVWLAASLRAW